MKVYDEKKVLKGEMQSVKITIKLQKKFKLTLETKLGIKETYKGIVDLFHICCLAL